MTAVLIITDPHQNLLFSLGIISNNTESKNMQIEFVKFLLAVFVDIMQRKCVSMNVRN